MLNRLRLFSFVALICGLFFAACSKEAPKHEFMPPLVVDMKVEKKDFPLTFTYVGEAAGSDSADIMAQVTGILRKINYTEGSYVEAGSVLFEIEPNTYTASLNNAQGVLGQAEANLFKARQNFERMQRLYNAKAISQSDFDNAKAAYDAALSQKISAEASVSSAKIQLGYTKVLAPVSGYSGKAMMTVGNLINVGEKLTEVMRVNPIDVNFSISNNQFDILRRLARDGKLLEGVQYAELLDSHGVPVLGRGEVVFVEKFINKSTGAIKAKARFKNDNVTVMPGQFVTVNIKGAYLQDAIMIPQKAVVQTQMGQMVVTLDAENIVTYKPITISDTFGNMFLVSKGLEAGERIVVEGINKAQPGKPVRIAEKQEVK